MLEITLNTNDNNKFEIKFNYWKESDQINKQACKYNNNLKCT